MASQFYTASFVPCAISDEANFPTDRLEVYKTGLRLGTRWCVEPGTEIELGVSSGCCCESCRGIVVECHRLNQGVDQFVWTLFFTEDPGPRFKQIFRALGVRDD